MCLVVLGYKCRSHVVSLAVLLLLLLLLLSDVDYCRTLPEPMNAKLHLAAIEISLTLSCRLNSVCVKLFSNFSLLCAPQSTIKNRKSTIGNQQEREEE